MRIFQKLFTRVKGRHVQIDRKVSDLYLTSLAIDKLFSLVLGILKTRKVIFLGRGTKVLAPRYLYAAKGVEISSYCQIDCLGRHGLIIGQGSKIGSFSIVKVSGTLSDLGQKIEIGRNVGIGEFAHIGGAGPVTIGDDTISGAYLSVHPENHNFDDIEKPIRFQGVTRQGIEIGKGCWIGAKVTFLDGSKIGDGCVVAAGAVVTRSFPDRVVIGGVPAKIIRHLKGGPV